MFLNIFLKNLIKISEMCTHSYIPQLNRIFMRLSVYIRIFQISRSENVS